MDVVEIYLNSKTADKQNGTANCVFHLPNIEVAKDESVDDVLAKIEQELIKV